MESNANLFCGIFLKAVETNLQFELGRYMRNYAEVTGATNAGLQENGLKFGKRYSIRFF